MEEGKEWNIRPNEIQTSFDVVNLYPSVPIDEAVSVIIEIKNKTMMIYKNQRNSHLQIYINLSNYV